MMPTPYAGCLVAGAAAFSESSWPEAAQSSGATLWNTTCTLWGVPPQVATKLSVTAFAKACFCSRVRPSSNSTRMIGIVSLLW
ncbi:hypothetical protein CHELA1G11_10128 [Hyphomicrobiales bacterium]|nr:hypothetical protein CHELA1G11_10128 [Hyphomicrobiales bacterium]CAH1676856.1 hypothetical protein CHELA1G2_14179 [Hyphomicrobiales bacterium]